MHSTNLGPLSLEAAISPVPVTMLANKAGSTRAHWVTLRLADAWIQTRPQSMQDALKNRLVTSNGHRGGGTRYLEAGTGACVLARPDIAEIMAATLAYSDGCAYHLRAWCIMPNHVHAVLQLSAGENLAAIIDSWKTFTAKGARRILRSDGAFWERQHYQRVLRTQSQVTAAVDHVLASPRRGSLTNWPWVWSDRLLDTACGADSMPPMTAGLSYGTVSRAASL